MADDKSPENTGAKPPEIRELEIQLPAKVENVLKKLPPEERRVVQIAFSETHSGPIPPPRTIERYEEVCPGAARDIINMAMRQQEHDHTFENNALHSEHLYRILGLVTAMVVVGAMAAAAVACAFLGSEKAAIAIGAIAGASVLAGVFVKGRGLFDSKPEEPPRPPQQNPKPNHPRQKKKRR